MLRLIVLSGPGAGREISVGRELVLGREGTDIVIDDPEISRRHAAVRPNNDGIELRDMGSRNGTFVNGHRIDVAQLSSDDEIRVGDTMLRLADETTAPATPRAAAAPLEAVQPLAPAAEPRFAVHATHRGRPPASRLGWPTTVVICAVVLDAALLVAHFA